MYALSFHVELPRGSLYPRRAKHDGTRLPECFGVVIFLCPARADPRQDQADGCVSRKEWSPNSMPNVLLGAPFKAGQRDNNRVRECLFMQAFIRADLLT